MEWATYLDHISADAARLSEVAQMGLEPGVPCCPGWIVRDLVAHVGGVYTRKATIIEEGRTDGQPDRVDAPDDGLIEWFDASTEHLLDVLSAHNPADPVWSFHPADQTVGFWYRRLAHESLIHRIDAEQAHGLLSDIDESLASDGIDEVLSRIVFRRPSWGTIEFGDRIARLEIPGRSWTVRLGLLSGTSPRSGMEYTSLPVLEFAEPGGSFKTVVAGSASAVDRWLWGRAGIRELEVQGDRSIAAGVRAAAKRST